MVTFTVVEPNTLLRLGILNLLETLDCHTASQGIDYAQLFEGAKLHTSGTDLMLLSVPTSYDHLRELVVTAQKHFNPHRILVLSDTQEPSYSLLNLPSVLAGYVCKFASQDILKASIMLVLAGGKCFPIPDAMHADTLGKSAAKGGAAPKRRWYDHSAARPAAEHLATGFLANPVHMSGGSLEGYSVLARTPAGDQSPLQESTLDLVKQEAALLRLTPRQYGILTLMAKGYPLKKISRELAISVATVKTHAEALYQRLGVNNRNAAVYAATSRGATLGRWKGTSGPAGRPDQPESSADVPD